MRRRNGGGWAWLKLAGVHRRRERDARSATPPRSCRDLRPSKLAHAAPERAERFLTAFHAMTHRTLAQEGRELRRSHIWVSPVRPGRPARGTCSITIECGRILAPGASSHWPVSPRPQLPGFKVSTEGVRSDLLEPPVTRLRAVNLVRLHNRRGSIRCSPSARVSRISWIDPR
jgi:hypothetical protein